MWSVYVIEYKIKCLLTLLKNFLYYVCSESLTSSWFYVCLLVVLGNFFYIQSLLQMHTGLFFAKTSWNGTSAIYFIDIVLIEKIPKFFRQFPTNWVQLNTSLDSSALKYWIHFNCNNLSSLSKFFYAKIAKVKQICVLTLENIYSKVKQICFDVRK